MIYIKIIIQFILITSYSSVLGQIKNIRKYNCKCGNDSSIQYYYFVETIDTLISNKVIKKTYNYIVDKDSIVIIQFVEYKYLTKNMIYYLFQEESFKNLHLIFNFKNKIYKAVPHPITGKYEENTHTDAMFKVNKHKYQFTFVLDWRKVSDEEIVVIENKNRMYIVDFNKKKEIVSVNILNEFTSVLYCQYTNNSKQVKVKEK
jgi:hypothetical protein